MQQQGHNDFPLTEDGEQQALSMGELLKDKVWHQIYCSDLERAVTSAKLMLSRTKTWPAGRHLMLTRKIREMGFGVKEGLPRGTSVEEAILIKAKALDIPVEEVVDNAEKPNELKERQAEFIRQLYIDCKNDQSFISGSSLLCVSHGGYIRQFIKNFCNKPDMEKIGNCSASVIIIQWNSEDEFECIPVENGLNVACTAAMVP